MCICKQTQLYGVIVSYTTYEQSYLLQNLASSILITEL